MVLKRIAAVFANFWILLGMYIHLPIKMVTIGLTYASGFVDKYPTKVLDFLANAGEQVHNWSQKKKLPPEKKNE